MDDMYPKRIESDNPQPRGHYSEAFEVDGLVFAAGRLPTDFTRGIPPELRVDPNFPYYGSDIKKRTHYILQQLDNTFRAAGSSLDHVVKAQVFLENLNDFNAFDEVWKEYFKVPPARTTVGTNALVMKDALIEVDLIGYVPGRLKAKVVNSDIPQPIANYTEAFRVGPFVFTAGQLPTDFRTGIPTEAKTDPDHPYLGSDIKRRTEYILKNYAMTLAAAGSSLEHVIKAQVFLEDLGQYDAFEEVWRDHFNVPPTLTAVETTGLLVKDAMIEIDLLAYVPGEVEVTKVRSDVHCGDGPYAEALKVGNLVFTSAQLPTDFATGIPAEARKDPNFPFFGSEMKRRTRYLLHNFSKTLKAAGSSFDHVFKAQIYMEDMSQFNAYNEAWREVFKVPPARSTIGTPRLLVKDAMIQVDMIGYAPTTSS